MGQQAKERQEQISDGEDEGEVSRARQSRTGQWDRFEEARIQQTNVRLNRKDYADRRGGRSKGKDRAGGEETKMVNKEWRRQRKERVCMAGGKKVGKVETSK